ncbi:Peroxidase [Heracleum sosnowskyi]|uniref:Peroxidase n=1 Tax=Heracleum sosnowskyi TaxID=360622 RepID=A0AAD8H2I0_9APIA|nr:Peroxidase [Heracleum sosnowskyi]
MANKVHILFFLLLAMAATSALSQGLRLGFYVHTCPQAEFVVRSTVAEHVKADSTVAPGLLRMIFHDCFVQGCDGSILLNGPSTEKTAPPNLLLRGYQVIDDAKAQLEAACPNTVSCADILALAARDAAVQAGALTYLVLTGRRDGRISLASDAANLPGFTDSVEVQKQKFAAKGLSTEDLVTLVGGHTIGTVACQFIRYRLYNYTTSGGADPSIDPTFLPTLQALCPVNGDGSKRIGLDYGSSDRFDHSFFKNVRSSRGILESDQRLWADASTNNIVQRYTGIRGLAGLTLNFQFGRSMIKMSGIEVKTGTAGEIRKVCSAIN